jgi:hypothetical protein
MTQDVINMSQYVSVKQYKLSVKHILGLILQSKNHKKMVNLIIECVALTS